MEWKFTEERPLRVFEAFAGYGSQAMALRNIGVPYRVVGISESQQYKMAGNSIVVQVLEGIFTQMFRKDEDALF